MCVALLIPPHKKTKAENDQVIIKAKGEVVCLQNTFHVNLRTSKVSNVLLYLLRYLFNPWSVLHLVQKVMLPENSRGIFSKTCIRMSVKSMFTCILLYSWQSLEECIFFMWGISQSCQIGVCKCGMSVISWKVGFKSMTTYPMHFLSCTVSKKSLGLLIF